MKRLLVKKLLVASAAVAALVAAPVSVGATTLTQGQTLNETFFLAGNGVDPINDLTADLSLTLVSLSSTTAVIDITLENTSVGPGTILSVGFATNPDADLLSGSTTGTGDVVGDADVFNGFSEDSIPSLTLVEICAWAGNNCSGGGINDGLAPGDFDVFRIILTGTFSTTGGINFTDFGIKFQGAPGSFEFYSDGDGGTSDGDGGTSPEPASLLLFGLALSAVGMRMRKARS